MKPTLTEPVTRCGNRLAVPRWRPTCGAILICCSAIGCRRETGDATTILRFANWGGPANDAAFLTLERELREEFERRHPGVRIRVENIPGEGQYVPKLLMTFVAGKAPDVMQLDASSAAVFIDNGLLLDLSPIIARDAAFRLDDYFANVVNIARRGDALYAIPLDFTPLVLFYNKRLFDRAGVPYPRDGWTWSDFLEAAKKLTLRRPDMPSPSQYGLYFANWMPGWAPWIWLNGGDVLSPDGRHAAGYFDSPQTMAAIQFLIDLIRTHRVAPSLSESAAAGVDLFREQRAAMNIAGHWMVLDYRADKLDFGVVSLPTNIGRPQTVMYECGLAINRDSPRAELAWEFIKHMTSESVQRRRVATGLAISANRAVARSYAGNAVEDAFLAAVEYARGPWGARIEQYAIVEDLGQQMIDDILFNVPVDEAVRRTARMIEGELHRP